MTKTTKDKYVVKEVLDTYVLPEDGDRIVKVTCGRGNNLHEVVTADGEKFLASMPPKFRKIIWIKRGDFVIIKPIKEGHKVKGEISHILYKEQIKYIKSQGQWPSVFDSTRQKQSTEDMDEDEIFVNRNRLEVEYEDDDSEMESSEDDGDDDEDDEDDDD
ncbi:probable RNA-binding protein EIF1AD [Centruroides vittatus]|uniref:probable RNA-binding protein EIF1AD n=1 Tax=Centruroides vittatus TaxID=120091 RepID=UPI003510C251